MTWLQRTVTLTVMVVSAVHALEFVYRRHEQMTSFLEEINDEFSTITHLYSAGKSVEGKLYPTLPILTTMKQMNEHKS